MCVTSTGVFEFMYFSTIPRVRESSRVLSMPVINATATSLFLSSASFILYSLTVLHCRVFEMPYFEPICFISAKLELQNLKIVYFQIPFSTILTEFSKRIGQYFGGYAYNFI